MTENPKQQIRRRLKVLFVDDERGAVAYFREDLENDDMEVRFYKTAEEAKEAFLKESFDVAIFDVMMFPGPYEKETPDGMATGLYLLRDFRKRHATTPVVVLTNITDQKTLAEIRAEPFVKVVDKARILPSNIPAMVRDFVDDPRS
jgi:CheY-like chemotaxis protein